jgi:hypothetical protein
MSLSTYRSAETIYTVIHRDPAAHDRLTKWTATSRSILARVEDNRMHIYDHNTFSLFIITWTHGWDNVMVWDPWAKRHVNI